MAPRQTLLTRSAPAFCWKQYFMCMSCSFGWVLLLLQLSPGFVAASAHDVGASSSHLEIADHRPAFKNAYATILYMGTPRDYEFFIAARVLLQSLSRLHVDAHLVLIASTDVPDPWVQTFMHENVRVVRVSNIPNPYTNRSFFNHRFKFALNKIYAWRLIEYERIVMLDVDNVFLRKTDELFRCGQFCAVFIDPCIFHTGLFVLEPSNEVYNDMKKHLATERETIDGADQGLLTSFYGDLLDKPLFHPPTDANRSRLNGHFRLPLGYQMDASYYYIRMKWRVPCGANSVITFPSASWLKPWYWWSWPVLPLGLSWHEQRQATIGYGDESRTVVAESILYCATLILATSMLRGFLPLVFDGDQMFKACIPTRFWIKHEPSCTVISTRIIPLLCVATSFFLPISMIPTTSHPITGWSLYLLGSLSLLIASCTVFKLELGPVITPWLLIVTNLLVMASPYYKNGITRMLSIMGFGAISTPLLWWSLRGIRSQRCAFVDKESEKSSLLVKSACRSASRNCAD